MHRSAFLHAGMLLVISTVVSATSVQAAARHIFVDVAADGTGDGTAPRPYRRISDALSAARDVSQNDPDTKISIHVAPGVYVGSGIDDSGDLERLPLIVDVPHLSLIGGTSLSADDAGLPTGALNPRRMSILTPDAGLAEDQALIIVTASHCSVSRFVLDGGHPMSAVAGFGIVVERSADFSIHTNVLTGGLSHGIDTSASSGTITGNFIAQVGCGMSVGAGSESSPAVVVVSDNRVVDNAQGGVLLSGGSQVAPLPELPPSFETRDTLHAIVEGNDLSGHNFGFGVRVFVIRRDPPDPANQSAGNLVAVIRDNTLSDNSFGISIDAGCPYRTRDQMVDPRMYTGTLRLQLEGNTIAGNTLAPALISFTRFSAALNPSELDPALSPTSWKYLAGSLYDIHDAEGELADVWLDHPATDPIDGRFLGNTLRIDDNEVPEGRTVPSP